MEKSPLSLGRKIRELRKARGLTQRELSARAGLDFTYVSKIENDRLQYAPSIKAIQVLAGVLEVDELELMRLADKVPPPLDSIASSAEALRFFRRASETVRSPDEWRKLLGYLEKRVNRRTK